MDLAEALTRRMSDDAGVSALVGNRVHWVQRDQGGGLPALVMRQTSRIDEETLEEDVLGEARIRFECFGTSHEQSWALAHAVDAALAEPSEVDGFELFGSEERLGPIDLGERAAEGDYRHRAVLELTIRHTV